MTLTETLLEMRHLMRERSRIREDLNRAMDAATSSGSFADGIPRGKKAGDKVGRNGAYRADLQNAMDNIDSKLSLYREDVRKPIEAIPLGRDAEALKKRYVEFLSVREIAESMNYDRKAMYRLLQNAEEKWLS